MFKQLVHVGIQPNKDLYVGLLHLVICLSNLYTKCEARPNSPMRERGKYLKDAWLNGGVQIEQRN